MLVKLLCVKSTVFKDEEKINYVYFVDLEEKCKKLHSIVFTVDKV